MSPDNHIVAVGARTPVGLSAAASAAAVRAGISRLAEHPLLTDALLDPLRAAWDRKLALELTGPERLVELVATALAEVGRTFAQGARPVQLPLLLGLPEFRPGWTAEQSQMVSRMLQQRDFPVAFGPIELFPCGHAAGLWALEQALAYLESGQYPLCVIAGVDSYLSPETVAWLDENRQLAASYCRSGLFPGEGAAAFLVAGQSALHKFGFSSLAKVRGIGTATEPNRIKTETTCLGMGLTAALRKALASLRLPEEVVHGVLADINGERYRSEEWGFAMLRVAEAISDPTDYELPVSCWGDMGAATGPLNVVLATAAGRRGYAKGPRYLLWNSSEGGKRAAAVLELNLSQPGAVR